MENPKTILSKSLAIMIVKPILKLSQNWINLKVFSLNGQNLGTIAINHGNARNISESKALDFLAETINLFYSSSGNTKKIPLCDGRYTIVVEQAQDRWRVVSLNGKILSVEYMDTVVTTSILPYPCDGSGDRDAIILQRTAHYYTSDGKSYAGVSGLLDVVITDPSFSNNPCLVAVFTKLGGSPTFQTYLKNFDSKFSVANLKLSVSSTLANNVNAETTSPINYLINIKFNENNLNRPALSIARTFMHEMIHAEIYRKLLSVAGQPQIQFNTDQLNQLRNDYPGLYDYYMRYEFNILPGQNPSDAQHEAMAMHYRDIIIKTLRQFDNTLTNETYEALSWEGLKNTIAWKKLPIEKQNNILSIISNFNNQNSNCQ
ncbi:MAG: hypothetical protein ACN6OI_02790 [Flavobacterium sp.]|uniref:hypothetical protein n=1 Tax=Flavobacterium sp. TaxID=239 RepID=UPI003D135CF3